MAESLKCAECLEMYTEPKILECLHSFCLKCLQKLINDSSKGVTIICPVCQSKTLSDDLSQLRDNIFLENISKLKQTTSNDETRKCNLCSLKNKSSTVKPSYMCLSCGDWLCPLCAQIHNMTRLTYDHRVISLEDLYAGKHNKEIRMKQHIFCKEHNSEILRFFCKTCSILVCIDCLLLKHITHDYQQPSDIVEELKSTYQSEIQAFATSTNLLIEERKAHQSKLNQLKYYEDELVDKIRKVRDNAISVVNEAASKAEADATKAMMQLTSLLRSKQNEIDKHVAARKAVETFCRTLLDEGSESEILYLHDMIEKGIRGSEKVTSDCEVEMPDIRLESKDVPRDLIFIKGSEDVTSAQCALPHESKRRDGGQMERQITKNMDKSKEDPVPKEKLIHTKGHKVICPGKTSKGVKSQMFSDVALKDDTSFVVADSRNQCIIVCNIKGEREWTKEIENVKHVATIEGVVACGCVDEVRLEKKSLRFDPIIASGAGQVPVAKPIYNKHVITANSRSRQLRIYGKNGGKIRYISLDTNVDIDRFTWTPNDQFFFSNHSKAIIGRIERGGRVSYLHVPNKVNCGHEFKMPCGICSDVHGNIFVADISANAVVKLSPTGSYLGTLDVLIPSPQGISVDLFDRLLVTGDNDKVWMVQL